MRSSERDKTLYAKNSLDYNMKDREFVEIFDKDVKRIKQNQKSLPSKEESKGMANRAFKERGEV